MDVVCTAGHVDHGKSTLVRALTGMEPDRFAEEQRRGLTIDLGFAWTNFATGAGARTVAFVDLPGHERFIGNMLAGAGPVRAALFVVAADEGWKPQSQEHLDILDLLEVQTGVVALTKADTVDAQRLAAARAEVAERLQTSSLSDAAVVAVSAATGAGLEDVRDALIAALDGAPRPVDEGRARLWVDRSFTIKGAGTVVTGTLTGGTIRTGDDVVVSPRGQQARVRGLQSLKVAVAQAGPGDRVAVNLAGIDRQDVARGDTITTAAAPRPATVLDAWIKPLPGERLTRRGAWHVHAGSGEWVATFRPLGGSPLADEGPARLVLARPAPLMIGDRFVLRDAGRRATVAGGTVLDTDPVSFHGGAARRARSAHLQQRRDALLRGDRAGLLALHVHDRRALAANEAANAVGLPPDAARAAARDARLLIVGPAWVDPAAGRRWAAAAVDAVLEFHAANPVQRAAPRDVCVRAAVAAGCPAELGPDLLAVLIRVGRLVAEGAGVRHPEHGVRLNAAQQRARDELLAALRKSPLSPPALSEAAQAAGADAALVKELEAAGELVWLTSDIALTADAFQTAVDRVHALYAESGPFTAAEAKTAWNTTRKYAVPLLELLDRRGITRRSGDKRDVPRTTQ